MTHQFLALVPLGPHSSEAPPCSLLFTIALLIQAFEPRVKLLLKVMYWLVLLLEGLDTLVEAALFSFDVRVVPLRFHVFHKRENELHERDLIFCNTQFRGKGLGGRKTIAKKSHLSLEFFAFVESLDFALEHGIAILKCLELLLFRVENLGRRGSSHEHAQRTHDKQGVVYLYQLGHLLSCRDEGVMPIG